MEAILRAGLCCEVVIVAILSAGVWKQLAGGPCYNTSKLFLIIVGINEEMT